MSEAIIKKNGIDYPLLTMPNHYPADRVYLDGDTTKNVQDAVDNQEAMIATVQPNLTAVKAYAKGEQFVYQGLLYKFTASCAQDGTITIGGNCELSDSVTEQIGALTYKVITLATPIDISTQNTEVSTTVSELVGAKEVIVFFDNEGIAGSVQLFIPKYVARGQAKALGSLNGYYGSLVNAEVDNRYGTLKLFNTNFATGGSGARFVSKIWYR